MALFFSCFPPNDWLHCTCCVNICSCGRSKLLFHTTCANQRFLFASSPQEREKKKKKKCVFKCPKSVNSASVFSLNLFPCILHVVLAVKENKCVCVCVWSVCTGDEKNSHSLYLWIGCIQEADPTPLHTHTLRALTVHPKACCVPQELKGKRPPPLRSRRTTQTPAGVDVCVVVRPCLWVAFLL